MADDLYKAYDQKLAVNTPAAAANFNAQYGGNQNAVGRVTPSPSGTDWSQTFGQNNPSSPSGTNWADMFGPNRLNLDVRNLLPPSVSQPATASSRLGTNWNQAFAGEGIGGRQTGEDYRSNPTIDHYRSRVSNSDSPLTTRDFERYGAGADFGLT